MMVPCRSVAVLALGMLCVGMALAGADDKTAPRTGRYRGDILDPATGEVIMRVAMQVPEKLPTEKHLGLLLLFHGYQGNEGNYIGLTVDALKRLALLDQYIVISGKSKGPGWTTEDDERVRRLMRWAKETYPIDGRRVFIFGSSNGAAFVGRFGSENSHLIAGVVGYCGSYKFAKEDPKTERPAETKTEWYFVHGGKDNPQNSRRACNELKAKGYRYIFRQMDGYGHTDIWDSRGHPDSKKADAVRDDWLLWLHALRHKEIAPSTEEQKTLATLGERLKAAPNEQRAALLAEAARIGGAAGGKVVLEALAASDVELRLAAARTTARTLYGKDVVAALVRLLKDEAGAIREAAIQGLGTAANWRYPEAQAALVRLATGPDGALPDRVRAVEALGRAARLPLLGNFEDGLLIWPLVLLLDDDNPQLREAAFAALGPHVEDSFDYKPALGPAERKAAVEKWKAWCQAKCGPVPELPR
jgi:hypothetical protein